MLFPENKRFGLTGGIACGKSTACSMMEALGWKVIDTDQVVHDLYAPCAAGTEKIVDAFGPSILRKDRSVDRAALGRLVFSDPEKLGLLNSLIHPLVRAEWQTMHQSFSGQSPSVPVLVVIPLMYESGMDEWFESIACIGSTRAVQVKRLQARGIKESQIQQRIDAQWAVERKMEKSQFVLWNTGSLELLQKQIWQLHQRWTGLPASTEC